MRKLLVGVAVAVSFTIAVSEARAEQDQSVQLAGRALPESNLAYPVMVVLSSGGVGSGFFLNNGTGLFLATAWHVLFRKEKAEPTLLSPSISLFSYPKDSKIDDPFEFQVKLRDLLDRGLVRSDRKRDVVVVRVGDLRAHPRDTSLSVMQTAAAAPPSAVGSPTKPLEAEAGEASARARVV